MSNLWAALWHIGQKNQGPWPDLDIFDHFNSVYDKGQTMIKNSKTLEYNGSTCYIAFHKVQAPIFLINGANVYNTPDLKPYGLIFDHSWDGIGGRNYQYKAISAKGPWLPRYRQALIYLHTIYSNG